MAEQPGPDDDFFLADGDSLTATRLASAQLSTGKEILVEDIFIGQTVSGIEARVGMAVTDACLPSGSAAVLSSAQRRLWFVEQFVPGVPVHNVVMAGRRPAAAAQTDVCCPADGTNPSLDAHRAGPLAWKITTSPSPRMRDDRVRRIVAVRRRAPDSGGFLIDPQGDEI
jgi:hypothetical protein